jgi:hypothetical protein
VKFLPDLDFGVFRWDSTWGDSKMSRESPARTALASILTIYGRKG